MAQTDAKYFHPRQSLYGSEIPVGLSFIIENSATVRIGDFVRISTAGTIKRVGVGSPILGRVNGIVSEDGINIFKTLGAPAVTGTKTGDDTYAAASDNATVDKVKAQVILDPAGSLLFYNDSDGTLAQTNVGQFFDVDANGQQVTQSTASDTSGQLQLLVIDPDGDADASKGLFRIAENQLMTEIGNGDAVNSA